MQRLLEQNVIEDLERREASYSEKAKNLSNDGKMMNTDKRTKCNQT